jgi:hypothetical protein
VIDGRGELDVLPPPSFVRTVYRAAMSIFLAAPLLARA